MTIETYDDWADVYADLLAQRNSLYSAPPAKHRVNRNAGQIMLQANEDEGYFGALSNLVQGRDPFGETVYDGPFGRQYTMGHGGRDDKDWTGTYAPFYDGTLEGIPAP